MNEIFPLMVGPVIGLLIPRLVAPRWRAGVLALLSIVFGAAASWISGELGVSWGYLLIDTAQVAISGWLMWALAARWHRSSLSFSGRVV